MSHDSSKKEAMVVSQIPPGESFDVAPWRHVDSRMYASVPAEVRGW